MTALWFDGSVTRDTFVLTANFQCSPGEVLGILGPNGSGKSTLIGAIAGLYRLTRGSLTVKDRTWVDVPSTLAPARRRVGLMTASGDLFPHLSALENVAFGLRARGATKTAAHTRAEAELAAVDITHLAARRPHELSSGQGQRVALARALALDPDVLLLDEPLAAIDQEGREELRSLLRRRLSSLSAVTLLVTHDPVEALTLADRLLFLEGGEVTHIETPHDVVRRPRTDFAARIVGLNLYRGRSDGRAVETDSGFPIVTADAPASGETAFVAFSPAAVSIWNEEPSGSPRNIWPVTVEQLEHTGTSTRVHLRGGIDLVAEVTLEAVAQLGLAVGHQCVATVKATDVRAYR